MPQTASSRLANAEQAGINQSPLRTPQCFQVCEFSRAPGDFASIADQRIVANLVVSRCAAQWIRSAFCAVSVMEFSPAFSIVGTSQMSGPSGPTAEQKTK